MKTVNEFLSSLPPEQYQDLIVFLIVSGHESLARCIFEHSAQVEELDILLNESVPITQALLTVAVGWDISEKTIRRAKDWFSTPLRPIIYEDFIRKCDEAIAVKGTDLPPASSRRH